MSAQDWGLPDVGYTGLTDTGEDFSSSSTLQDTVVGQPNLTLDGSSSDYSVTDFSDITDPYATQSLSGTTDPPLGSQAQSQPTPVYPVSSSTTNNSLNALSKFGSAFAALLGGSSQTSLTGRPQLVSTGIGRPATALPVSGSSTVIMVIVAVALIALLMKGGE